MGRTLRFPQRKVGLKTNFPKTFSFISSKSSGLRPKHEIPTLMVPNRSFRKRWRPRYPAVPKGIFEGPSHDTCHLSFGGWMSRGGILCVITGVFLDTFLWQIPVGADFT